MDIAMHVQRIFQNIEVCTEAFEFLQELLEKGSMNEAESLMHDVQILANTMIVQLEKDQGLSAFAKKAMLSCMNMEDSIQRFFQFPAKRQRIFQYEILVSFCRLQQFAKLQYEVLHSSASLKKYREQVFHSMEAAHSQGTNGKKYRYKASIMVTAYNQLEYTKRAIESIFKYTDFSKGDVELITLNNGSTDGTEEYFEGLPHEKKIYQKYNMIGTPFIPFLFEGEYVIGFSNDVVATPHWLEQLIFCMKSCMDIAVVVPTCNEDSISAMQGIPVPYSNDFASMDAMEKFAAEYNRSNPNLWEDRMVVMPFVSVWRSSMIHLPFIDLGFYRSEFVDDDYSTLFRRTGWRMVLAKDTFLHHFGGVTLKAGRVRKENNALVEMRKVYFDKWGVDAWDSYGTFPSDYPMMWVKPKPQSRILWIEPRFGMDFLKIKNYYRQEGCGDAQSDALILDQRYLLDAKPYFDRCVPSENLSETLAGIQERYDFIGMGVFLHELEIGSAIAVLEQMYGLLKPGGSLIVPLKNWGSACNLVEFIRNGGPVRYGRTAQIFRGVSIKELRRQLLQNEKLKSFQQCRVTNPNGEKFSRDMALRLNGLCSFDMDLEEMGIELDTFMVWFAFLREE